MAHVNFFNQGIAFKLPHPRKTSAWIQKVIKAENFRPGQVNFIFCSDDHLLGINLQYLNHNTYTDIITFDNSEESGLIEGDIFISIDRISENAENLKIPFIEELHRVLVHGVLHLTGYSDKTSSEKTEMRKKEDAYLSLR